MKTEWVLGTVLAVIVGMTLIAVLKRRNLGYQAQVVAVLLTTYLTVPLSLWATNSHYMLAPGVNVAPNLKTALLALSGGWLARVLFGLDKVINAPGKTEAVTPILLRPILGAFSGLVVAVLWSHGNFSSLGDETAILSGVAGGAAGVSVLDLVRTKMS